QWSVPTCRICRGPPTPPPALGASGDPDAHPDTAIVWFSGALWRRVAPRGSLGHRPQPQYKSSCAAAGADFITLRALPPDPLFALPKLRYILLETWHALPKRLPNVTLDEFVIMPDHVHFILWLDGTSGKGRTLGKIIGAYKSLTTVLWLEHLKSVGKDMHSP